METLSRLKDKFQATNCYARSNNCTVHNNSLLCHRTLMVGYRYVGQTKCEKIRKQKQIKPQEEWAANTLLLCCVLTIGA